MHRILFSLVTAATLGAPQIATAGDAALGGKLFIQCRACHTAEAGKPNGVGPNLSGIVGRKAATRAGYAYSPAMTNAGFVWNAANLDAFLTKPSARVPGTKMSFVGVGNPKNRADIIAYLGTLKP